MVKTVVQEALNGLVEDLRATHGANLASVVLYGSAAAGDHIELRSDYNILIALNRITPEDLRQAYGFEWDERRARRFQQVTALVRGTRRLLPAICREWPAARRGHAHHDSRPATR